MRILLAAAVLLLAVPSGAQADVFSVGDGLRPGVAVDDAGTAYIAWTGPEALSNTLQYCRLPRAASSCNVRKALPTTGNSLTRPHVDVRGTRVTVVQYRYQEKGGDQQGVYEWISNDGGANFGDARRIGSIPFSEALVIRGTDAGGAPQDTFAGVTNAFNEGQVFQSMPLATTGSDDQKRLTLWQASDRPYNGAIGLVDDKAPLVISLNGSDEAAFRRYTGADASGLEQDNNWTPSATIGTFAYPKLAGGGAGLFATGGTSDRNISAITYTGSGFSAPVAIAPGDSPNSHLAQDAGQRLHAVFNQNAADGLHLVHAVSENGTDWRVGAVVVQQIATDGGIGSPRVAAAKDHVGVVVWEAGASKKEVRVSAIGPDAPKPRVQVAGLASVQGAGVVILVAGRLKPPGELTKAQACGEGKVRIRVARGKKPVVARSVPVRANCSYKLKAKVPRGRVGAAHKLRVRARFGGNDTLASAAKTTSIRVR